jgi:hypothetical protein
VQDVPAERFGSAAGSSQDDVGTTEVRVPEAMRDRGDGPEEPVSPDMEPTTTYARQQPPEPGQGPQDHEGYFPPGPTYGAGQHQVPPAGAAGGGGPYGPAPGGSGPSAGDRKKMTLLLAAAFAVVTIAVVGGLLAGTLFSGGSGKKKPAPASSSATRANPNFATVTIASGRLSVSVPKEWQKGTEETWVPSTQGIGFTDTATEPVLRAAPSIADFRRSAGKTPGVFVGLTTAAATVPPQVALTHPSCTKGAPENYTSPDGALSGQVVHFTGCTVGVPLIAEVGLKDKTGTFSLWIRIKQIDTNDLTRQILDSLRAH